MSSKPLRANFLRSCSARAARRRRTIALVAGAALLAGAASAQRPGSAAGPMATSEPSFDGIGWKHGITGKTSWGALQVWAADRFELAVAPAYRALAQVAHVTVEPGDKVGGWSGERAEVAHLRGGDGRWIDESAASGTQYFAFSIFLPRSWRPPQIDPACRCRWGTPLQLHGPDAYGASPPIALSLTDSYGLALNAGDLDALGRYHTKNYAFSDGSLNLGAWTDFVLRITFADDDTGSVSVWRRNQGAAGFALVAAARNVATLQKMASHDAAPGGHSHYWKQGFYRSTSPDFTSELFLSGLVRAPDWDTAVATAFGR